jgi:hypothetical protein
LYPHTFGRSVRFNTGTENVSAARETFCHFFMAVQEHFLGYCKCREVVKLFKGLAVMVHPARDLKKCAELHCSLTDRDLGDGRIFYMLF